jgi:hypothetical protein
LLAIFVYFSAWTHCFSTRKTANPVFITTQQDPEMATDPSFNTSTSSAVLEYPLVVEFKASSSDLETHSHQNDKTIIKIGSAQDFCGPDDLEDPLNWPVWKKVYHTTMVGLLCFTM